MPEITDKNWFAWALAIAGVACGVGAAAMQGGWVAGLTAASAGLNALAGVSAWTSKAKAEAPK